MTEDLVRQSIELPGGELGACLQPEEWAGLPDDAAVEWAPLAPYWSVLWRSGVALARELDPAAARGAARGRARLRARRAEPRRRPRRRRRCWRPTRAPRRSRCVARNARGERRSRCETAVVDWAGRDELVAARPVRPRARRGRALRARRPSPSCSSLLPRLGPEAWVADPGRPAAGRRSSSERGRGGSLHPDSRRRANPPPARPAVG